MSFKNTLLYNAHFIANSILPLQTVSKFQENGTITAEEFVRAGDLLILKCPNWSWSYTRDIKEYSYLPSNKQFLIIKSVPCSKRINDSSELYIKNIDDLCILVKDSLNIDALNIDSFEEPDLLNNDANDVINHANDEISIVKTRTYDITITYDNYYRCARLWLYGFSEYGNTLTSSQIFEDIDNEFVNTTTSYELHPHFNFYWASIHPCRHAQTMLKMSTGTSVDKYLFIFLKFMQTVIPNIEYDFTDYVINHANDVIR